MPNALIAVDNMDVAARLSSLLRDQTFDVERRHIPSTLEYSGGDKNRASKGPEISLKTFYNQYGQ